MREEGVWDFKGKAGNLKVGKIEQITGKQTQILAGPPRDNGV